MRKMLLALCVSVGACMPNPAEQVATRNTPFFENSEITNPFETPTIAPVPISNADLVRDFLDLSFSLESGLNPPSFTRFEGPISLRLTGVTSDTLMDDLNRLLLRLEDEAGLEIYFTEAESATRLRQVGRDRKFAKRWASFFQVMSLRKKFAIVCMRNLPKRSAP